MIRTMIVATCVLGLMASAKAQPAPQQDPSLLALCPEVGTPAPPFAALTRDEIAVNLADLTGPGGAVIVFSRSLDWCPYCKTQALELKTISAQLTEAGWPLSLITYDPVETLSQFADEHTINYTLLSDSDSAMIDAFGLRNTEMRPGSRFDGVPHPAIVYIGSDGMVRGVQQEAGYKDRPPTEGIVQLVNLLNQDLPAKAFE